MPIAQEEAASIDFWSRGAEFAEPRATRERVSGDPLIEIYANICPALIAVGPDQLAPNRVVVLRLAKLKRCLPSRRGASAFAREDLCDEAEINKDTIVDVKYAGELAPWKKALAIEKKYHSSAERADYSVCFSSILVESAAEDIF